MKSIAKILLDIDAIKIDPNFGFTWASGIKSPIYCDNRKLISYPNYRDLVADSFVEIIKKQFPQTQIIAGTATAGIPHAAWIAQKLNLPMIYVRSKPKAHGKSQQIEGVFEKNKNIILIEDLISTGKSSIEAFHSLKNAELNVLNILSIMTYKTELAEKNFKSINLDPISLITVHDILDDLKNDKKESILSFLKKLG